MEEANDDLLESSIAALKNDLPSVFARKEIPKLLGGVLACGTLANLSSLGIGPPCMRNGRHAIYEKESFLAWLKVYFKGGLNGLQAVYHQRE